MASLMGATMAMAMDPTMAISKVIQTAYLTVQHSVPLRVDSMELLMVTMMVEPMVSLLAKDLVQAREISKVIQTAQS